jgi:hypothetical protein
MTDEKDDKKNWPKNWIDIAEFCERTGIPRAPADDPIYTTAPMLTFARRPAKPKKDES